MRFKAARHLVLGAVLVLSGVCTGAQPTSSVVPLPDDSLFQQFGALPGMTALMDDFVERLTSDARLRAFFKNTNKAHLKAQLTDQLCEVSGGPCRLKGPTMATVHADMAIGKGDFNTLVELLQQSMDSRGIPFAAQNRMLAQLAPMHRDIIAKD